MQNQECALQVESVGNIVCQVAAIVDSYGVLAVFYDVEDLLTLMVAQTQLQL